MASSFSILVSGQAATDLTAAIAELDVEENVDLPGAFSMTLTVNRTSSSDYDLINDARLAPLSNICITAAGSDGNTQCIIDGYVLAQTAHLDTGTATSTLKVWGQDATWLMNTTEQVVEWADVTDGAVANTIFGNYGMTPDDANLDDDSPAHTSDSHSLMQRATDAQFLRRLARRNGKLFRVFCTDTPGQRTGSFARPSLDGDPAVVLTLNGATAATVDAVDITWDVMRPSATVAWQELFTNSNQQGAGGTVSAVPCQTKEIADAAVLRMSDTCTVARCSFMIGNVPSPCITVQWVQAAVRVQAGEDFVLNESSVGLCLAATQAPQGSVLISATQSVASGL